MKVLILLILLISQSCWATSEQHAIKALAKIAYIETDIRTTAKKWERKYVPTPVRKYGPWIAKVVEISQIKKVSYTWRF